jgi:hypothetical protein
VLSDLLGSEDWPPGEIADTEAAAEITCSGWRMRGLVSCRQKQRRVICKPKSPASKTPSAELCSSPTNGQKRLLSFAVGLQSLRVDREAVLKRRRRSHRWRTHSRRQTVKM